MREQRAAVRQDKSSYHEHDKYQQTSEEDGGRSFPPTMLTELLGSALPIVLLGHSSHPKRKGLAASLVAARKGVPSARFTTPWRGRLLVSRHVSAALYPGAMGVGPISSLPPPPLICRKKDCYFLRKL